MKIFKNNTEITLNSSTEYTNSDSIKHHEEASEKDSKMIQEVVYDEDQEGYRDKDYEKEENVNYDRDQEVYLNTINYKDLEALDSWYYTSGLYNLTAFIKNHFTTKYEADNYATDRKKLFEKSRNWEFPEYLTPRNSFDESIPTLPVPFYNERPPSPPSFSRFEIKPPKVHVKLPEPPPPPPFQYDSPFSPFFWVPPMATIFLVGLTCLIIKKCIECSAPPARQHQQNAQTRLLLPTTVRRQTQQSSVRPAPHGQLRVTNSRSINNDLPPPYSSCVHANTSNNEEPPPRFSDCFLNSKVAEPQVHIRLQNITERAHPSTDIDNGQDNLIENGRKAETIATTSNDSEYVTPGMRTELVPDNDRIVERLSLDLNSNNNNTGAASNDNVEEQSTKQANVVYVDETANVKGNTLI